jgi:F-type H+-transporting ATPase subunit a
VRINWSGKRRWIALGLVIANIIVMLKVPPVIPVIQLPGEVLPGGLQITNTLVGSFIVWILIGLLIWVVSRSRPRSGAEVPRAGFYNFFELAYEGLYNFLESIAGGPYMRFIFSFFMTIFIIVLLSNWLELIPGVDSVGILEPHIETNAQGQTQTLDGYDTYKVAGVYALNGKCPWVSPTAAAALTDAQRQDRINNGCVSGVSAAPATTAEGQQTPAVSEGEIAPGDPSVPWVTRPIVRVPSTDLNLTISLALIAVIMIQYIGVRANGPRYFTKFVNYTTLLSSPRGAMDLGISLLEMLGEFAKILSFSFRLLGNIFAGSILLFVISFLVPAVVPWALFLFELFVGLLQAIIFGLLTAIFMSTATAPPHGEEHHEAAEAAH